MREFFHGWRRKTGCVLLVMACVMCGMWMRSRVTHDGIYHGMHGRSMWLSSCRQGISWTRSSKGQSDEFFYPVESWGVRSWDARDDSQDPYEWHPVVWRWHWLGFDFGEHQQEPYFAKRVAWTVPYWSIVILLTLLSAYLLPIPSRNRPSTTGKLHG
jgi:hypothetical protein